MAGEVSIHDQIKNILLDGKPHTKDELAKCLLNGSDPGAYEVVRQHVSNIRKEVRERDEDIICFRMFGKSYYQHHSKVLVESPSEEDLDG